MHNFSDLTIHTDESIVDAMAKINANSRGLVFVCDQDQAVLATLTDGDIRRHILSGNRLDVPAIEAANKKFSYLPSSASRSEARKVCIEKSLTAIPLLDSSKRLVSIYYRDDASFNIKDTPKIDVPVIIMAGGKGTRLYPYTKILPKPLIPIGEETISERIISQFKKHGCQEFYMIVNHKKNMIKAYFSEEQQDININFIDEDMPLGTGGGLKLLEGSINKTFFMSNCDVLIFEDYKAILNTHKTYKNIITMVCAAKNTTIPYGTIEVGSEGAVSSITEKPSFSFLVNTGLYIIEPEFLSYIKNGKFTPITECIQACIDAGERVGVFPVSEDKWLDMGQLNEMNEMKKKLGIFDE